MKKFFKKAIVVFLLTHASFADGAKPPYIVTNDERIIELEQLSKTKREIWYPSELDPKMVIIVLLTSEGEIRFDTTLYWRGWNLLFFQNPRECYYSYVYKNGKWSSKNLKIISDTDMQPIIFLGIISWLVFAIAGYQFKLKEACNSSPKSIIATLFFFGVVFWGFMTLIMAKEFSPLNAFKFYSSILIHCLPVLLYGIVIFCIVVCCKMRVRKYLLHY